MSRSSKSTASKCRVLITTGDQDGIGWEVTQKALTELGPQTGVQFVIFTAGSPSRQLTNTFDIQDDSKLAQALIRPHLSDRLLVVRDPRSPAHWVEEAARACMTESSCALVTAPLSKITIRQAGLKDIGHTEILSRIARTKNLFMGFRGDKFSVVLLTGHSSLKSAIRQIKAPLFRRGLAAAGLLQSTLPKDRRKKPIAVLGLNPHAGEQGLLGQDEQKIRRWMNASQAQYQMNGPLVPDAAFLPHQWDRFSVYLALYHDQGLIPFKLAHGFDSGVHLTLGLPFVRTSVDHGTAKDLFGKNRANHGSMRDAILTAIQLQKRRTLPRSS